MDLLMGQVVAFYHNRNFFRGISSVHPSNTHNLAVIHQTSYASLDLMPRYHIYHQPTGTLLARDLFRNVYPWLMDHQEGHEVVPFGSFVEVTDSEDPQFGALLLDREGMIDLPRDPETETEVIRYFLAQDEETRVAWAQVDSHLPHFIAVNAGEWKLERASEEVGVCWVAWIRYQGRHRLVRAAYGRDEAEAKKRLTPAAQERLESEARGGSNPGLILGAKIGYDTAEDFARTSGFDPHINQPGVRWLVR